MCLPLCLKKMRALSRCGFLASSILASGGVLLAQPPKGSAANSRPSGEGFRFSHVVDLTHQLTVDFPTGSGQPQLNLERVSARPRDRWNIFRWVIHEHTGTHLDAPLHCSDKDSADRIPAERLVGPVSIVDIRAKAATNADAELTVGDLKQWESQHGPIPAGGIVAMCSGWDAHVRTAKFRNAGSDGALHTPGFHREAADFLLAERDVAGIVVDTLSLDRGLSHDFPVHERWLGANRWGLECVANLGELPPAGATMVVGAPKIAGAM
jgi:kynurenine formamidase